MAKAAKTEKRRFVPPMPIADLWFDPRLMALPSAGYGIVMRLLLHFWITECRPLPANKGELRSLARAYPATWRPHEATIIAILHDFCPELSSKYDAHMRKRTRLAEMGAKGNEARERAQRRAAETGTRLGAVLPKRRLDMPSNYAPDPGVSPTGGFRDRAGR